MNDWVRLLLVDKRDTLLSIIAFAVGLLAPDLPKWARLSCLVLLVILTVGLVLEVRQTFRRARQKHLPIAVIIGCADDDASAMIRDVLEAMRRYDFDQETFRREFDVEREDWVITHRRDLSGDEDDWRDLILEVERKIQRLAGRCSGRKTFHLFFYTGTCAAMGVGAVLGTRYEVVLHHYQPGAERVYSPVIDFFTIRPTNLEGVHILMSRLDPPFQFITVEEPEEMTETVLVSLHLAGHDPKGAVSKLAKQRELSAVHVRSTYAGTIPINADWLRVAREVSTILLNLLGREGIQRIEIYPSAPLSICCAIGMALGTHVPLTLYQWFSVRGDYSPVLRLDQLRQR